MNLQMGENRPGFELGDVLVQRSALGACGCLEARRQLLAFPQYLQGPVACHARHSSDALHT